MTERGRNYRQEAASWRGLFRGLLAAVLMEDHGQVICLVCQAMRSEVRPGAYPTVPHAIGCPVADYDREVNP